MNPMIFPKMLTSHEAGWEWLMRIHPSVTKMYLAYVVPMSLIPPAMLLYASRTHSDAPLLGVSADNALFLALVFFITELLMVPIMGRVIQLMGGIVDSHPAYKDAFVLAAVAPTPFWLAPIALFVPSVAFNVVVMLLAVIGAAMLIYQGIDRVFQLEDEGRRRLAAGFVLAAGLVAWVAMGVLTFVSWGSVLT